MKYCVMCKNKLSTTEFHKNRARPDKLDTRCKLCSKERRKILYHENPAKEIEKSSIYRKNNLEKYRQYARKYRTTEKKKQYNRVYKSNWLKLHPEHNQRKRHIYRARKHNASGTYTLKQATDRIKFYGYRCWICSNPYEAIDHVKPLSRGGSNFASNLRPICKQCNSLKGNQWPYPVRSV